MQSGEAKFASIFESGCNLDLQQFSDAKLRTNDGCTFDIHKVILVRSSDYFRAMFCGMGKERKEFRVPGISGECLSDILGYFYTGGIRVTERNLRDLMIGADYLLLDDILAVIKQSLKVNMTEVNCLRILHAAHQINDEGTFRECFRFIQTKFEGIIRCQGIKDDLADLPLEILRSILCDRSLYVYNESTVWQTIVAWTQKDMELRMSYVPQLLLTLAIEEIGKDLATDILQQEIISENSFMKDLAEARSSNNFDTDLDVLLTYLRSYSIDFTQPNSHRIPLKLHVMSSPSTGVMEEVGEKSNLYMTYDENIDLWRKIIEVDAEPEVLIVVGHNIYMMVERICMNFDLSTMDWVPMQSFRNFYFGEWCVVVSDARIYVLGEIFDLEGDIHEDTFDVEVYNTRSNRWYNGVPLHNISHGDAVVIEKKIYVVGNSGSSNQMLTQMFDPDTQHWVLLSPPTIVSFPFTLVAYHRKIYLMAGSEAEAFDPIRNTWKRLPKLPYTTNSPRAVVFNDQIIVRDRGRGYDVRWNNAKECWEELDETYSLKVKDLHLHQFCTISDVETIKMITKENRDPEIQMEKRLSN